MWCCHERAERASRDHADAYLVDMIGIGGSALQEDGGDPDVDEGAMSPERHRKQTKLSPPSKAAEKDPLPTKQNAT